MPSALHPSEIRPDENVVVVGLTAAIVAVEDMMPCVVVVEPPAVAREKAPALPSGPFDPHTHRTLEIGLRQWVKEQAFIELGYVEQLYTFGDRGRHDEALRVLSVGYLALTRQAAIDQAAGSHWQSWYAHFPWEDWRDGRPGLLDETIGPALERWCGAGEKALAARRGATNHMAGGSAAARAERIRQCFGLAGGARWDEERVLERYELLYEAGLVHEAVRDRSDGRARGGAQADAVARLGQPMIYDHRRILATAMGRLRAKLKYRPVIFELMPETFTLLDLQHTVEAISGARIHKQNFRRLVEHAGLVEETGTFVARALGRPAQLFRFRREVLSERPAPGVKLTSPKHLRSR
jgi:hypothetical protein